MNHQPIYRRIGTDLEFAVKVPDRFIPASFLPITGTKGHPEPLEHGGVEIDNVAVEITPPPSDTEDGFVSNVSSLIEEIKRRYADFPVQFLAKASAHYTQSDLLNYPFAMVMGCSPDYNAWTGEANPLANPRQELRTFGGHIHIEDGTVDTVKACDLVLGMWSVVADEDVDRRKMYGKAGAYRPKPYGVEYRVLSNFWAGSETLMRQAYRYTRMAQRIADPDKLAKSLGGAEYIQSVINNSIISEAECILQDMEKRYAA